LNSNDVYLYYVDVNGHIQQIIEDFQVTDTFNAGISSQAALWTGVGAFYNQISGNISVAYGVDEGGSTGNYGPEKHIFRFDFNPSNGAHFQHRPLLRQRTRIGESGNTDEHWKRWLLTGIFDL
jgi:hypothetical protein